MKIQTAIFFSIISSLSYQTRLNAQPINRDSLRYVILTTKNATQRVDALNDLAKSLRFEKVDTSKILVNQALLIGRKISYHQGIATSLNLFGNFYLSNNSDSALYYFKQSVPEYNEAGNLIFYSRSLCNISMVFYNKLMHDSALYYARKAISALENQPVSDTAKWLSRQSWNYSNLAVVFYFREELDSSIFYCLKSTAISESSGELALSGKNYNLVATIYSNQKNYTKAIEYSGKAYSIYREMDDGFNMVSCLFNKAMAMNDVKDYRGAMQNVDTLFQFIGYYKLPAFLSAVYSLQGNIKLKQNDCPGAIESFKKGIDHFTESTYENSKFDLIALLGRAYNCTGNYAEAIKTFQLCLKEQNQNLESKIGAYYDLSSSYEHQGNHKQALEYYKQYVQLHDSINTVLKSKSIADLNLKYETEKREQKIKLLASENESKSLLANSERQQKNFAFTGIAAILLFSGFAFYRFRKQKQIENQKAVTNERLRISRDLHDDMGATLSSISVSSVAVKQRIKDSRIDEATAMLDIISEDAQNMVTNMSDMVWMINQQNDTMEKLFDRMNQFAAKVLTAKNILFDFNINDNLKNASVDIETRKNIFLVFKEAINNAAKYSGCTEMKIDFIKQHNQFLMRIADNGKGFNTDKDYEGNGLNNMKKRADEIYATLTIRSKHGEGTLVSLLCDTPKIGG